MNELELAQVLSAHSALLKIVPPSGPAPASSGGTRSWRRMLRELRCVTDAPGEDALSIEDALRAVALRICPHDGVAC